MKNAIYYYYNLNATDIHQTNKTYKFNIDNDYYTLIEIQSPQNIGQLYELSIYLNKRGIYTVQIILNNQNSLITNINQINYVLLKGTKELNKIVTIEDIIQFSNITRGINYEIKNRDNWYTLWIEKIDYFEYQINELKTKYPIIKESFNYFSGLTETAISLLANIPLKHTLSIGHNRIKKNTTLFELYNPLNFIIDINIRDVAEYIKELSATEDVFPLIKTYIENNNLTVDEIILLYIRLLYPSYYFDKYEEILEKQIDDREMLSIINRIPKYEEILKKTYILIKDICQLPEIEWLTK